MLSKSDIKVDNGSKFIGRDDNSSTHNYFYQAKNLSTLQDLLRKFEEDKQQNPDFDEFTKKLENYLFQKIESHNSKLSRDLSEKLCDGNRNHVVDFALSRKHAMNKKIHKYGLFKTANDVFVFILAQIETKYTTLIKGKILSGNFQEYEIDDLIDSSIIQPLWSDSQCSSLIENIDDLYGLMYLLAGNCFIDWDSNK